MFDYLEFVPPTYITNAGLADTQSTIPSIKREALPPFLSSQIAHEPRTHVNVYGPSLYDLSAAGTTPWVQQAPSRITSIISRYPSFEFLSELFD
jgi:hypothetical protein